MARPIKENVDYFPHMTEHGKTLFILENTWGNDGYATWFKVLEMLGRSDGHYIDCRDASELDYLAAYCHVSLETLTGIIDKLAALNAINGDLWRHKLIYSQNFVDGIKDAYRRRPTKLPTLESVCMAFGVVNDGNNSESDGINPENQTNPPSITEKGKGKGKVNRKDIKEIYKEKILSLIPPDFQISDRVRKWAAEQKRNHLEDHLESFKLKCQAKKYKYADWDAAFMNAIRDNWARMGEQNGSGNNGGSGKVTQKTGGARSDDVPYPVDVVCTE